MENKYLWIATALDNGTVYGTIACMERKHPCFMPIPMRLGRSGRPVTPEEFIEIQNAFTRQFGGFTPIGPTRSPEGVKPGGQWLDPETGEIVHDMCWIAKVSVAPNRLDAFRKIVGVICGVLEQKVMYVEILPPSQELIPVFDDHDDPDSDSDLKSLMEHLKRIFSKKEDDTQENAANA